jgi:hypothetical protein
MQDYDPNLWLTPARTILSLNLTATFGMRGNPFGFWIAQSVAQDPSMPKIDEEIFALGTPTSTGSPAGFRRGRNGMGGEVRLDIAEGALVLGGGVPVGGAWKNGLVDGLC